MQQIISITTLILSFFFVLSPIARAQSTAWSGGCVHGYTSSGQVDPAADVATIQGIECLVANLLATAITIIGIAAFVMFLVGGFKYLTSGSDSKGVSAGKGAITYAIIGIVVALASFLILRFIVQFTGVQSLLFFNTQIP